MNIVYIEASMVNRWNLAEFAQRTGERGYEFSVLRVYEFDKSARLEQALARTPKPDVIVLQECAVYFPGDVAHYQRLFHGWIRRIKAAGVRPVIATVVPPARSQGLVEDLKAWVKDKLLGGEGQTQQVLAFNDWLRQLAREEAVALLDIEQFTRDGARFMRAEYDEGDGIHLNPAAYRALDRELLAFLRELR